MKKQILLFSAVLFSITISAQEGRVGINTKTPNATLDVTASADDLTRTDGIIAPRLKGAELKAKDSNYTSDQTGAIVYVTKALAPSDTTTKTVNVTEIGYYYFDGTVWVRLVDKYTEPWNIAGTTNSATSNTQDIYQMGRVALGINYLPVSSARLLVSETDTSGGGSSILTNYGIHNTVISNNTGAKYGIYSDLTDISTSGSGTNYGVRSYVTDMSKSSKTGYGGYYYYGMNGSKDNGNTTHVHGLSNIISLTANGGDLSSGYSYANIASAYGNATGGNLTINALRAYSGYVYPSAYAGRTFTSTTDVIGGHIVARPRGDGTINIPALYAITAQFETTEMTGGTLNVSNTAATLNSFTNFAGSGTYNINRLIGLQVGKAETGSATKTINSSYGIFINPFRFAGDNAANAYNLYSQGGNTKNYFQGKVGIGEGANSPASNLKVTGLKNLADNAAALGAGLAVGDFYHTNGVVKVVY